MSKNNMVATFNGLAYVAKEFRGENPALNRLYTIINSELPSLQWELFEQKNMDKIVKYYTTSGKSFVLLTAWKDDKKKNSILNLDRQWQLKQDIQGLGFGYLGVEFVWKNRRTNAFLIPNMTKDVAASLGNKWEQEYVLFVERKSVFQVSMDYKEERFFIDKLIVHDTDYSLELYSALKMYREKVHSSDEPDKSRLLSALGETGAYKDNPNYFSKLKEYIGSDFADDKNKELMLANDIVNSHMDMPDAIGDMYVKETAKGCVPGSIIYSSRKAGPIIGFVMPGHGLFRVQSVGDDNIHVSDIEEYRFGHSMAERIRTEVFEAGNGSERNLITHWIATLFKLE